MPKRQAGFSLLEILLALMIIAGAGFFLLVQIPHGVKEKGIELSAVRLLEDLRETQQAAIAENGWYRVRFYPSTGQYMIFRQGELVKTVDLPKEVQFSGSPAEMTFLPTGAPAMGNTVVLTSGNLERRVIVAPVMGRIRMEIVRG